MKGWAVFKKDVYVLILFKLEFSKLKLLKASGTNFIKLFWIISYILDIWSNNFHHVPIFWVRSRNYKTVKWYLLLCKSINYNIKKFLRIGPQLSLFPQSFWKSKSFGLRRREKHWRRWKSSNKSRWKKTEMLLHFFLHHRCSGKIS